jgi:hypothetical protein
LNSPWARLVRFEHGRCCLVDRRRALGAGIADRVQYAAPRWRILTGGGQGALAGVRVTMRCVSSHFNGQTSTIIRHSGTFGKAVSSNWRGCADTPHLN